MTVMIPQSASETGMEHPSRLMAPAAMRKELLGGISEATLYRLTHNPEAGFPKAVKIGRKSFWRVCDVVEWIGSRAEVQA